MGVNEILKTLREKHNLTQEELAERILVTRQAVSRWETGETQPNTETLKLLSREYNVSINTLLGSPQQMVCQCCGMPLEDSLLGRNRDGSLSEEYCRWCYADGVHTYSDMDELIDVSVPSLVAQGFSEAQARTHLHELLPTLEYWKNRESAAEETMDTLKAQLIEEINALKIEGMPRVTRLIALAGEDVNLPYPLPNGETARFLTDRKTYLGNRLEPESGTGPFFGILADAGFILVCTYEGNGENPVLLLYKKR